MRLLFLDIDGPLAPHIATNPEVMCGQIHADKVSLLNRILRDTDARIVLSSAWRYLVLRCEMNLAGMEWLLRSHGILANRLIGITAPDTIERKTYNGIAADWPVENERGLLIQRWLDSNAKCEAYVVIDDFDLGISVAGHPFVHVDGTTGLTPANATQAIDLLLNQRA